MNPLHLSDHRRTKIEKKMATIAPSPSPTAAPTEPEHHDNCLMLSDGQLTSIKPSPSTTSTLYNSQCVMVPSSANVIRSQPTFSQSLPSLLYQTMLVTSYPLMDSDVMDLTTGKLALCENICKDKAPVDCSCVESQENKQQESSKNLYFNAEFESSSAQTESMAKYFTIFSNFENNILMNNFASFNAIIEPHSGRVEPITFAIAPSEITSSLLSNAEYVGGHSGKVEKVQIVLPQKEEDARLQLTAIPLVAGMDSSAIDTISCLINDDVTCHVWLDPTMDYNIQIVNQGKKLNFIELSVYQQSQLKLSRQHLRDYNIKRNRGHRNHRRYSTVVGVVFVVICLMVVVLCVYAFKRGNKAVKGFAGGIRSVFSGSKRPHYLQSAYAQMGEAQETEIERQQAAIVNLY